MRTIGLTGGIGMGKSAAEQFLRRQGIPVVDTDRLAKDLVAAGQPALAEIAEAFGAGMVGTDGELRRTELARVVFADAAARKVLEGILHPRIRSAWRARVAGWAAEGRELAVIVIPLLFETGAEAELDETICVACGAETQDRRLQARGWSAEQILLRRSAQWPIERKMAASEFVIWNESSLEVLGEQLRRVLGLLAPGVARVRRDSTSWD